MNKISILIVDDHHIIRDGIRTMLQSHKNKYVFNIEESSSGEGAIEKIKKHNYDIVLMDYQLVNLNGSETTKALVKLKPEIKILALSNYDESLYIDNIMNAGAKGYILKSIDVDELIKAITTILNGQNYYSNEIAVKLISHSKDFLKVKKNLLKNKIGERELEILKLIAESYTNKQIAQKIFLSKRTVDNYRYRLLKKMSVNNTISLLKKAKMLKLID